MNERSDVWMNVATRGCCDRSGHSSFAAAIYQSQRSSINCSGHLSIAAVIDTIERSILSPMAERGGGANTRTPAIKGHRPFNPRPHQPLGNASGSVINGFVMARPFRAGSLGPTTLNILGTQPLARLCLGGCKAW